MRILYVCVCRYFFYFLRVPWTLACFVRETSFSCKYVVYFKAAGCWLALPCFWFHLTTVSQSTAIRMSARILIMSSQRHKAHTHPAQLNHLVGGAGWQLPRDEKQQNQWHSEKVLKNIGKFKLLIRKVIWWKN